MIGDVPDKIENNTIYLVGEKDVWVIIFKCPCGCSDSIYLNTDENEDPFWRFRISNKKISIYPSVKRVKGCRSHFFVTRSSIDFVWNLYSL